MLASVRTKALLHSTSRKYTYNGNESINSTVKKWVDFKNNWPQFIQKLQVLVELQFKKAAKSIYKCGEYVLAPAFSKFALDQTKWHQMQPLQL